MKYLAYFKDFLQSMIQRIYLSELFFIIIGPYC